MSDDVRKVEFEFDENAIVDELVEEMLERLRATPRRVETDQSFLREKSYLMGCLSMVVGSLKSLSDAAMNSDDALRDPVVNRLLAITPIVGMMTIDLAIAVPSGEKGKENEEKEENENEEETEEE